jgi:hypothetical protein
MSSRSKELNRLRAMCKVVNDNGGNIKPTRRSGGLKGLGGDLIDDEYLIEEKPNELMTKAGQEVWDKIEQESIERGRTPILIHGGLMTVRLSDGLMEAVCHL